MTRFRQGGFSLMELAASTALVGSLAAIALPHFSNLQQTAHYAVMSSLSASLFSAAEFAHLKQKTSSLALDDSISFEGNIIEMKNGYPTQNSIGQLIQYTSDFQYQPTTGHFYWQGLKQCHVRYETNLQAFAKPHIYSDLSGCEIKKGNLAGL